MKANTKPPLLAIAGAVLVTVLVTVFATALIPVPTPRPDLSRMPPGGATASTPEGARAAGAKARDMAWTELVPKGWDPVRQVSELRQDLSALSDDDPRAAAVLKRVREVWDHAPANSALDGVMLRIAGYVVPLEVSREGSAEFLLVPYYGACIHAPPPPSNQIIHVHSGPATRRLHAMDAVRVSGSLTIAHTESEMGTSSYRMDASAVEAYAER